MTAPLPPQSPFRPTLPGGDWSAYAAAVTTEYEHARDNVGTEGAMQEFFERHPSALPGAFPGGIGQGPYFRALITQPALAGIGRRTPDFMWLTRNTAEIRPVFIELEAPTKKWVVGAGSGNPRPSKDLTHAITQLETWREWLAEAANQEVFFRHFGVPAGWTRRRKLRPEFWLIMGRTSENSNEISKLRNRFARHGLLTCTYDTYPVGIPEHKCRTYSTLHADGAGRFTVRHVPPTVHWDASPEEWRAVSGRADAVRANPDMDPDRARLLIDDIQRWDQWVVDLDAYNARPRGLNP